MKSSALFILLFLLLSTGNVWAQGVGINGNGQAPHPSAMLDVSGTTSGVLLNRMTTSERDAISDPAVGLIIYNTDCDNFNYYTSFGWRPMNNNNVNVDQPGGISGSSEVCASSSGILFSTSPVPNAEAYTWSYTGTGMTITSGQGTSDITADFAPDATPGTLKVAGLNACGVGPSSDMGLNVSSAPPLINATAAGNVAPYSFTANWDSENGVWGYYVDVATDVAFSNILPSYNNQYSGTNSLDVTGLSSGTTYYIRVRSFNNCGTSSDSNVITVTTTAPCSGTITDARDGQTYPVVQIGSQCWMQKNLNYDQSAFGADYCYNGDPGNCTIYGRHYDWYAMMQGSGASSSVPSGVQGVCPSGWHVPSDQEWCMMENTVQPGVDPGCNAGGWRGAPTFGPALQNNSPTGFAMLYAGYYYTNGGYWYSQGSAGAFWTASQSSAANGWSRIVEDGALRQNYEKNRGYSVRCVKD